MQVLIRDKVKMYVLNFMSLRYEDPAPGELDTYPEKTPPTLAEAMEIAAFIDDAHENTECAIDQVTVTKLANQMRADIKRGVSKGQIKPRMEFFLKSASYIIENAADIRFSLNLK